MTTTEISTNEFNSQNPGRGEIVWVWVSLPIISIDHNTFSQFIELGTFLTRNLHPINYFLPINKYPVHYLCSGPQLPTLFGDNVLSNFIVKNGTAGTS
jgi:hypothetical protein